MEGLTRREFLTAALVGAAMPGTALLVGARELVPGEVVSVPWPPGLGVEGVRLVHLLDGRERSRTPVSLVGGRRVEVVAMPADGRMRPGRHEFLLELPGRLRISLGGFSVARYRFGC